MMKIDKDADYYIITADELKIYLAGLGYDKAFGLFNSRLQQRDELIYTLKNMTGSDKLLSDGEKFIIPEPIDEAVSIIGSSKKVLVVYSTSGEAVKCYYCGAENVECRILSGSSSFGISIKKPRELACALVLETEFPEISNDNSEMSNFDIINSGYVTAFKAKLFCAEGGETTVEVCFGPVGAPEIVMTDENGGRQSAAFTTDALQSLLECILREG